MTPSYSILEEPSIFFIPKNFHIKNEKIDAIRTRTRETAAP
jgi:hypothetical protein